MADVSAIQAHPVSRDSIIMSRECAVGLMHLAILTEDRDDDEQSALICLAAALDVIDPGHAYVDDTIATRDEHG